MNIAEISERFHKKYISNDISQLIEGENITYLDIFPNVIDDIDEYSKKEIYYQGMLDGYIYQREYYNVENRYIEFVKNFLIENITYFMFLPDSKKLNFRYFFKKDSSNYFTGKNRFYKRKIKEMIRNFDKEHGKMYQTNDQKFMEYICKLALRDAVYLVLYFENADLMLIIRGCIGVLNFNENTNIEYIYEIADKSGLYIYEYNEKGTP